MNEELLQWEALEYEERERTPSWFWAVGAVTITISVVSFIYGNILFGIFIILSAITMIIMALNKPRTINFSIQTKGVSVDTTLLPYSTLNSFFIEEYIRGNYLILESKKHLMPHIAISIPPDIDLEDIRGILLNYLEEGEHRENLPEKIMDYLGF